MKTIGASVITMDHLNFETDVKILDAIGEIDYLHMDIMDGHFVPRFGIYPEIIYEISKITDISLDLHLMVSDVEFTLSQVAHIKNIKTVSFHYFINEGRIFKIIDKIKSMGAIPIIALDLSTPINSIVEILESGELGGVMFMGIHPGVLDQTHRPSNVLRRLPILRSLWTEPDNFIYQIDGGCNFDTIKALSEAGINSFVGGSSSIFKNADNPNEREKKIRDNIQKIKNLY